MRDNGAKLDPQREALDLWESGRLTEAEAKYREAFALTVAGHWGRPHIRAGLASLLAAQGRSQEARAEFEQVLEEELALARGDQANPGVVVARYFLADHLVGLGSASEALVVLTPSLGSRGDYSLRLVEARAHASSGDAQRAIIVLRALLERATTDEQRIDIESQIETLLESKEQMNGRGDR